MARHWPWRLSAGWRDRFASVRWRLTFWYVGMLTVALLVFGGVVYAWQAAALRQQIDGEISVLRQEAGALAVAFSGARPDGPGLVAGSGWPAVLTEPPPGWVPSTTSAGFPCAAPCDMEPPPPPPTPSGEFDSLEVTSVLPAEGRLTTALPPSSDIAVVLGPRGEIIEEAGPLNEDALARIVSMAVPAAAGAVEAGDLTFTMAPPGGEAASRPADYQFYAKQILNGDGTLTTIVLGRPNPALGQLQNLTITLLAAGVATLVVVGAGGYWLATRAMRPVRVMTQAAREIGETDLSRRLNLGNRDELGELAATFDGMLARLEAAFRRQRQFTNDASHELRTPLAIVQLEIERALAQPSMAPVSAQALTTIQAETGHMIRLVNDLLILARADGGRTLPDRTEVDLSDVALEVVERLAPLAQQRGIDVRVGELPELSVFGNRLGLTQMLSNLTENAIKFTAGHGRHVTVETSRTLRDGRSWAEVAVSDTGPGIPAEHLPHLFDRFYRVDQARSGDGRGEVDGSGSGLGLAIVRWAATAHGGEVRVDSEVGRGSTFAVWIPLNNSPFSPAKR